MNQYFVYILSSNNKSTLYIGVTSNLKKRALEHKSKQVNGFSEKYNCDNLVYFEEYNQVEKAIKREKQLKKWKRKWKDELIEEKNPLRLDLSIDWN